MYFKTAHSPKHKRQATQKLKNKDTLKTLGNQERRDVCFYGKMHHDVPQNPIISQIWD